MTTSLEHNNTNEDSSNPGEDEFFSFIVDTESYSAASDNTAETETEIKPTCAQMASLTVNVKMEQALLPRTFKQILKRSVMTMSCFSTSQVFQGLEQ